MPDKRAIDTSRSGWLGQFLHGHESDIQGPAKFTEEFFGTAMMNADSRAEDTLSYAMTRKDVSFQLNDKNPRPMASTPSYVFKYHDKDPKHSEPFLGFKDMSHKQKLAQFGIGTVRRYLEDEKLTDSDKRSTAFSVFHHARDIIFGSFKVLDTLIRWPVIAISFVQLFLERAGWALRNSKNGVIPGLVLSALSVAANAILSIAKVLVEFFRAPLAVVGGIVGFVFGGITAMCTRGTHFVDTWKCLLEGTLDGIRPFAPALADNLTFYVDGLHKNIKTPMPWGTIIGAALAATLIISLSVVSLGGIAGILGFAPFIVNGLGLGSIVAPIYLTPFISLLGAAGTHVGMAFGAVGILSACTKACSMLLNGLNAFVYDSGLKTKKLPPVHNEMTNFKKTNDDAMSSTPRTVTSSASSSPRQTQSSSSTRTTVIAAAPVITLELPVNKRTSGSNDVKMSNN